MRWYALLLTGVFCISTSAILVTLSGAPPTVSAFYRNFFAAVIWLLLFPWSRPFAPMPRRSSSPAENVPEPRCCAFLTVTLTASPLLLLLAVLFSVDLWAWHRAIFFLGAGPATLMGNLQVLIVSLLAVYFFRERLGRWFWFGVFLALFGIGLLTMANGIGADIGKGLAYGGLTALTYSFFLVLLRILDRYQVDPPQILFRVALFSALFLWLIMAAEGASPQLGAASLLWLFAHAFVSSVVGWWLIIRAMPRVRVSIASTLLLLQPVLTSIWGHFFLGQILSLPQVIGILLALAGIRLATWQTR